MDDPVLHRKIFRAKALKVGALKPKRYQLGTGPKGIEGSVTNPYYTTESQGQQFREFVKEGKRYIVDPKGQIVKIEYLPAVVKEPPGVRPAKGVSGTIYKGLETILDPESAYKRGTYGQIAEAIKPTGSYLAEKAKSIGSTLINPETYTKTIPEGVVKGIKTLGPGIAGFTGAAYLGKATGNEEIEKNVNRGLSASGLAEGLSFLGLRGVPYAGAALNLVGGPTRLLANPWVGIPVGTAALTAYGLKKRNEYLAANPEAAQRAEQNLAMFNEMGDPYGNAPVTPSNTLPITTGGTPTPPGIDDWSQVGGPPSGGQPPSGGNVPPVNMNQQGGLQKPIVTPFGEIKGVQDISSTIADTADKAASKTEKETTKKQPAEESWVTKLGNFARSTTGNAFMLKFAAGLLSGKGSFGEIVGKALDPAVTLMAEMQMKEDELANKQFLEMMKASKVKQNMGIVPIVDNQGNKTFANVIQDDVTKQASIISRDKDGKEVLVPLPANQWGSVILKPDKASPDLEDKYTHLANIFESRGLLGYIQNIDDKLLGTSGAIKDIFNTVLAVGKGATSSFSTVRPVFDNKESEKMWDALDKKGEEIFSKLDKQTIKDLATLKVNATNLKYYLANALKDKDRLTQNDLQRIDELFNVLSLRGNPEDIKQKAAAVEQLLISKQNQIMDSLHYGYGQNTNDIAQRFYKNNQALRAIGYSQAINKKPISLNQMTPQQQENYLKNYF